MFNKIQKLWRYVFNRTKAKIEDDLLNSPLLNGLNEEQIIRIKQLAEPISLVSEQKIFTQDEKATHFYVIEQGEVALVRQDNITAEEQHVTYVKRGEILGESSFAQYEKYEFSAVVKQDTKLWRIPAEALNAQINYNKGTIAYNLSKLLGAQLHNNYSKLAETLDETRSLKKIQYILTQCMIHVFIILSMYIFAYAAIAHFSQQVETLSVFSSLLISIFAISTIFLMRSTGLPLAFYGVTFKNGWYAIKDSLIFTLPVILLIIVSYKLLLNYYSSSNIVQVLRASSVSNMMNNSWLPSFDDYTFFTRLVYFLLIPFQELIARGALQSILAFLAPGRFKLTSAIIVSNLIFAALHVHGGLWVSALAFAFGVFWGILYARQKTLVGVCASHLIVGLLAVYVQVF